MLPLFFVLGSYLLGSVSFGYLVFRLLSDQDITKIGSGNPGATNVLRTLGVKAGLSVFFLDVLKGFIVIFLSRAFGFEPIYLVLAGLAVIIGHNWPLFFSFKGGKGAATTLGVFFGIDPFLTLVVLAAAILLIALTRYVSLGSISGGISIPFVLYLSGHEAELIGFGALVGLMVFWRHIPNIKRLMAGTENKISFKKNAWKGRT